MAKTLESRPKSFLFRISIRTSLLEWTATGMPGGSGRFIQRKGDLLLLKVPQVVIARKHTLYKNLEVISKKFHNSAQGQ
jgi:hypothetical protein